MMRQQGCYGQRRHVRRSGRLIGGLLTSVVLLAACATPVGPAETTPAAQPTTSSPTPTPAPPSVPSLQAPTSTVISTVSAAATTASPSEFGTAVCYYTADLDKTANSTNLAFGYKDGEDNVISVQNLVDACHESLVRAGKIKQNDPATGCVLTDGQVGVLPGTGNVCTTLNLPVADPAASATLPSPGG